jgi:hypothetical protein
MTETDEKGKERQAPLLLPSYFFSKLLAAPLKGNEFVHLSDFLSLSL